MFDDVEPIFARLRADPVGLLGRKSITLISAFTTGYEFARVHHGLPALVDPIAEPLQAWAEARFGWTAEMGCRQNLGGFAQLFSTDDAEAFDLFFQLRDQARAELTQVPACEPPFDGWPKRSLVEWLCDERFRTRTQLHIGDTGGGNFWAFCNGFLTAERDIGHAESPDAVALAGFSRWMWQRYPFADGRPWSNLIDFLSLGDPPRSKQYFFDAFDQYRAGDPPDGMSTNARRILAGITKQVLSKDPDSTFDDVADVYADVLKRIAPS